MNYVKQFHINGVDTKQVACIELQGAPNAATEGAVGVLGMDMTSPTHDVYRCVAVNGSVYTWELLSAGMSILNAIVTYSGAERAQFFYAALRIPNNYRIKRGDLILDSEGYLYQIDSLDSLFCNATYCGTHIGGISGGDKDYSLRIRDGKLQLVTESDKVISNIDYLSPDDATVHRDSSTGTASVIGVKTINGGVLRLFVGRKAEYDNLTEEQKNNLFAIITDDTAKANIEERLDSLEATAEALVSEKEDEWLEVSKAKTANVAGTASTANVLTATEKSCEITTSGVEVSLDANSVYALRVGDRTAMLYVGELIQNYVYIASMITPDNGEEYRRLVYQVGANGKSKLLYQKFSSDGSAQLSGTCYYKKISG